MSILQSTKVSIFRTSQRGLQFFWKLLKIDKLFLIFKNFRKIFRHEKVMRETEIVGND